MVQKLLTTNTPNNPSTNNQPTYNPTPNTQNPPSNVGGATPPVGEGLGNATSFNASDFNWDWQRLGWRGNQVALGAQGGNEGLLQQNFFGELFKQVPRQNLMGQTNGNLVNQYLRQAYNGVDPIQAADSAAQAILGN